MAVFTAVEPSDFRCWVSAQYGLNSIEALTPIAEGIENTNYLVKTPDADYVFTIFECWERQAVEYYAALMQHMAAAALPVPAALNGSDGNACRDWQGKPCLLVPFAAGSSLTDPTLAHCEKIGVLMAQLHIAAADFSASHPNPRGIKWRRETADIIRSHLSAEQVSLLDTALAADIQFSRAPLPQAACHCDLFRNNVLWQDDRINAAIDFYFGGHDSLLFDLAVCICDWCYCSDSDDFQPERITALLSGYNRHRRLCALEKSLFTDALNSAALRFWLSRHYDILFPRQAQMLTPHDPMYFERILRTIERGRVSLTKLMERTA